VSSDAHGELVAEILAPDELSRLFSLLGILTAAETNARILSLMLQGLKANADEVGRKLDLTSAVRYAEQVVTEYRTAIEQVSAAIKQRHAPPQEPAVTTLH
jgi:hypothetical protein